MANPPVIDVMPPAPVRTQAGEDYAAVADIFAAAMVTLSQQLNVSIPFINNIANDVAEALGNLNNQHYDTYAEMIASTQTRDGVVAIVDKDPDDAKNGWYYYTLATTTWDRLATQPVTGGELASLIQPSTSVERTHIFEDGFGFMMAWIDINRRLTMEGGLDMSTARLEQSDSGIEFLDGGGFILGKIGSGGSYLDGLNWKSTNIPGIEVTDENGFILSRFDGIAPLAPVAPAVAAKLHQQQRTQIMHILGYGQSLSRGINAIPAISTTQSYSNLTLASGTKGRAGETGYNATTFIPLVEATVSTEGETPVTGWCNGLVRRNIAAGEAATDWVFLGTSPGRSGRAVEQLGPDADPVADFNKMIQQIKDCKAVADAQGKSYSVWAYGWDQGESNYVGSYTRSPYQYTQLMLALFDTLTKQVLSITGQEFQPFIFSYQVAGHRFYSVDKNTIALAQWRVSRERADFVLAVPVYAIPTLNNDVHLTSEGSWLLGEYKSRAMQQTMVTRSGKWRPLEPISVSWGTTTVDIKFYVPKGPIVLDTALCAMTTNYGFDIREAGSVVTTLITAVAVLSEDTIRLTLSRAASADAVVSYARGRNGDAVGSGPTQGARGNLRDSHGDFDKAVSPLGNTFSLHNPCVMFEYNRASGF